jgi:hypothetical protein
MLPLSVAHILLAAIVALSILMMLIRPRGIAEVYWISGGAVLLAALRRCTWSSKSVAAWTNGLRPSNSAPLSPAAPSTLASKERCLLMSHQSSNRPVLKESMEITAMETVERSADKTGQIPAWEHGNDGLNR